MQADVVVPEYMLKNETDKRPFRPMEMGVPLSQLRLVYPLPHPETGIVRDVVVKKIMVERGVRWIPGLGTRIPWPKKEEPEHEDYDEDTLRMEVETETWLPTLLRPPMPPSVIDELRGKFSKFRTRHDEEYIAKKTAEDVEMQKRKGMNLSMRTPIKELNRKVREEKKARGKPQLSEELLVRIGQVMAAKKGVVDSGAAATASP